MLNELGKLAVASTAATLFIWVLSLLAPRCLRDRRDRCVHLVLVAKGVLA
jgi:hypothetical protein